MELDQIDQIDREINRLDTIINGLKGNEAWNLVIEDSENQAKELDSRWCFIKDADQFQEMRVTKMAVLYILGLIDMYEQEKEVKVKEKADIINIDANIAKDYDNG